MATQVVDISSTMGYSAFAGTDTMMGFVPISLSAPPKGEVKA